LIMMRHAEAEAAGKGQDDRSRELTKRGLEQARGRARELQEILPRSEPILLLASEAVRARQTAEWVAEMCGLNLQLSAWLYEAGRRDWEKCLAEVADSFSWVIAVGHNPGISQFASQLLMAASSPSRAGFYDFSVAGALYVAAECHSWQEVQSAPWCEVQKWGVVNF
jgi:phosphohistidine phosphatase